MVYQYQNLDLIVLSLYLIGIFCLAFFSQRKKVNDNFIQEQYLAGQSLTIPESLFSIIATEVSALTFLGIPAFAFGKNYSFLQIYIGAIFGRLIIAKVMLPLVYSKGLTIYEVMGKSGSRNGQRSVAIFYAINKFLAVGVRLFSGSILVAEFFNQSIYISILIISILTFFYTLIGGLKAVVRTDMVQMSLFITGGIVAHILIPETAGVDWSELMLSAHNAGKTSLIDFSNMLPFLIGVAGGILFDMATHGVDQDFAQRLTANKSLRGAQISIIFSSFISIAVGLLFLSIGSLLWSYYQIHPMPNVKNDQLFAHFITMYFPVGLKGLMVAGVLAATMSTLDSSINALSACFYNDIFNHKVKDKRTISKLYSIDTILITAIFMAIALVASSSDGLLILGLKITSWTAGSLVGLFFATLVFKIVRLTPKIVIGSYIMGTFGVYLNTYIFSLNWNFNVYSGFGFTIIFCFIMRKLNFHLE